MLVLPDSGEIPRPSHIILKAICIDEKKRCAKANERNQSNISHSHNMAANQDLTEYSARNYNCEGFVGMQTHALDFMPDVGSKPKNKQVKRQEDEARADFLQSRS